LECEISKLVVTVVNIVASATLGHTLDLNVVKRVLSNSRYDPHRFPAVIYYLRERKSSALIFSSGKIVCAGAKNERQARDALKRIVEELRIRGVVVTNKPVIVIENVVATTTLGVQLDLEDVAYSLERTVYDPEQFPGLIYRISDPPLTFLIFANGKIVCAGAKSRTLIEQGVSKLEDDFTQKNLL
jgi:transcription initiation factor TFIID TATA-box-binding protein